MKNSMIIRRFFSLVFAFLIMTSVFAMNFPTAKAAEVTKIADEKSYDIAVVFDNSGSMYQPDDKGDSKAWCRAKYL